MARVKYSSRELEARFPALAARAVKAAYKRTLKAGNSVLIVSNGSLIKVNPDKSREVIRELPKSTKIPKGTTFKIN